MMHFYARCGALARRLYTCLCVCMSLQSARHLFGGKPEEPKHHLKAGDYVEAYQKLKPGQGVEVSYSISYRNMVDTTTADQCLCS